jgi:hypothetical protein
MLIVSQYIAILLQRWSIVHLLPTAHFLKGILKDPYFVPNPPIRCHLWTGVQGYFARCYYMYGTRGEGYRDGILLQPKREEGRESSQRIFGVHSC